MSTKVKICGIKDNETARACIDMGVDYLGFNFSPKSKRQIDIVTFEKIYKFIQDQNTTKIVFLFYKNLIVEVKSILSNFKPDFIQYVEDDFTIDRTEWRNFSIPLIPQIGVKKEIFDKDLPEEELVILDSYQKGEGGGTGKVFPWRFVSNIRKKYFLAGGLNPSNVVEAIKILSPFGVDVASGVESSPGVKNIQLIKDFINNAKRA
jgi:phosphoribosylanthranilate isomerase